MKTIPILKSKKNKWLTDEEAEKIAQEQKNGNKDYVPNMKPLDTLHIIHNVIHRQEKGPHGEPKGYNVKDQYRIFKVLDAIEALPEDANEITLQDAQFDFIVKKTKAYKDRWWAVDRIFTEFEKALGISEDEDEEDKNLNP